MTRTDAERLVAALVLADIPFLPHVVPLPGDVWAVEIYDTDGVVCVVTEALVVRPLRADGEG